MSEQTLTSDQAAAGTTYPAAGLERRFHAFTLDRLVAWALDAAGIAAAYLLLVERGRTAAGVAAMVGTVLLVSLAYAVLLGLRGTSPGRAAVGLRVVDATTGTPIGVGRALLRTAVLGVATLPTFGLGVATLAWTAVMDVGARRRGWHDHLARSVVVDVRPAPVEVVEEAPAPRAIVNLTAMRLAPRAQTPPDSAPRAVARPEAPAPVTRPTPEAAPDVAPEAAPAPEPEPVPVPAPPAPAPAEPRHAAQESASLDTATSPARTRRRRLGYPLVGQPPAG
ncbi:RDD family protein, partial [Nocardioides dongkuii]